MSGDAVVVPVPGAGSAEGDGTRVRVWWGRLARAATGALVLGLVALVVVVPRPERTELAVAATLVEVAPPRSTLVCAGPLILPDDTGAGDSAFDPTPVAPVTRVDAVTVGLDGGAAATGTLAALGVGAVVTTIDPAGGGGTATVSEPTTPVVVQADPVEGRLATVAGVSSAVVTAGDLRGLAAASCQRPATELWLVGGSTEISSSAQLVIDNPGTTVSEVSVEVWGPSGPVDLAGGGASLVAPGAERVVVLPAIAAEQRRLVVRVVATGGNVTAHVQDSQLRGFTPAGTDLVVPGSAPATRQVVAGVVVAGSTVDDADAAVLRLLVPGTQGGTARLTLLGPDGVTVLPGAEQVELAAGEVTDVPLGGLPAGGYTAVVEADVPVVAAVMVTRTGLPGELDDTPTLERAWAAAGPTGVDGLVAVPGGTRGTLVLGAVASGDDPGAGAPATGTLRALGPQGAVLAEVPVSVAAGTTVEIPVADLGAGVTGVQLVTAPGDATAVVQVTLAWALVATVDRPDGELVSVLVPTSESVGVTQVPVRASGRLGIE